MSPEPISMNRRRNNKFNSKSSFRLSKFKIFQIHDDWVLAVSYINSNQNHKIVIKSLYS